MICCPIMIADKLSDILLQYISRLCVWDGLRYFIVALPGPSYNHFGKDDLLPYNECGQS